MTEPKRVAPLAWIGQKVDQNIWAIFAAALAAFAGHLQGTTTASHRLDVLEREVAELNQVQQRRREFMVCTVRNLDRLNAATNITPACPLIVPE